MNFRFEVLREAMKIQGVTFAKLSALCGSPESTLKKLSSGDVEDPRISTILPPFRVLGLSIDRACGLAPERDMRKEAAEHEVSMVTALQERLAMQDAKLSEHRHTIMEQGAKIAAQQATLEANAASISRLEADLKAERAGNKRLQMVLVGLIVLVIALAAVYIWDVNNLHKGLTALFNPNT